MYLILSFFRKQIRIGSTILAANSYQITVEVINSSAHPNYTKGVGYYDIAILETEIIEFTDFIQPICLPSVDEEYDGKAVELVGWGSSANIAKTSRSLKRVSIAVVPFR